MPQITGTPAQAGTYKPVFVAQDSLGNLSGPVELDITVNTPVQPGGGPPPLFPLPIVVEILINGTWSDISQYVYQRDAIHITAGKSARADKPSPAQCTMTLNNRDGRFTPRFANSPYYPYLQQNTQIRVSVNNATSSSGNLYSGYRFWGEVAEWPPVSDVSGQDVYVQITANGPKRRINQGGGEGSALQRYYASLTGLFAPVAYWPCEEDPLSTQIGSGILGTANMIVASGTVKWKAISNFNGSAPIGVVNRSTWTGVTSTFGTSGDDLFEEPGTWQWVATTPTVNVLCAGAGGGGSQGMPPTGGGGGGGGAGIAGNTAIGVTPGKTYQVVVGAGGQAGSFSRGGSSGQDTIFAGDSKTVRAAGGKGAGVNGAGGAGGSGGAGGVGGFARNGGAGGSGASAGVNPGGGGGGGGGIAGAGNAGGNATGFVAGTGGAGGGGGQGAAGTGRGGDGGFQADGRFGSISGGGGGGGGGGDRGRPGGGGAPGSVELIYTAASQGTQPSNNVIRFIMFCPQYGGVSSSVLVRGLLAGGAVARLDCQYRTSSYAGGSGSLRLFGYDGSNVQLFDSGNLNLSQGVDGKTVMVSMELAASGANVAWALQAIYPGRSGAAGKTSGTIAGTMGSVSQIIVDPNGDVTKTGLGHISVQYALIPLWQVSMALDGHQFEGSVDRFIRLANEQVLGHLVEYNEGADHWGFETGIMGWAAAHAALTISSFAVAGTGPFGFTGKWPPDGASSLLMTADGTGSPSATAPAGLAGQPVQPGDVASLSIDLYAPAQLNNAYIGLQWYDITGTFLSESDTADTVLNAAQPTTLRLVGAAAVAPANAQFCVPALGNHGTLTAGTLLYADNVRLAPHMGPQTRKAYRDFLEEIEDADQGIIKEARELFGLKFRTRIRVINQSPSVKLDYSQNMLSQPLAPVLDTQSVKNNIIVHRHKGSKVEVTVNTGQMSILEPPAGVGRYKKIYKAIIAADEQLAALATHLLNIGTAHSERYPTITVDLTQASLPGNPLAPLMSAVAGVEIGDMVELDSLPFWYPSTTAQQMVIGYDETLNSYAWTVTWNCATYSPFVQVTTAGTSGSNPVIFRRW